MDIDIALFLLRNPPYAFVIVPRQWPPLRNSMTSNFSSPQNPGFSYQIHRQIHAKYRRWDSNAETFRTQKFNFSSKSQYDDDDDEDDDMSADTEQWYGVLEEFVDYAWIFKVFRSFGWMLPPIILSMLLATGPTAFFLALALTLSQSVLSLVFEKLWGRRRKPKWKAKSRKKNPGTRTARNVKLEEEEEAESQAGGKKRTGYRSWVPGNDIPFDKNGQDTPGFGGWDELDRQTELNKRNMRSTQRAGGPRRAPGEKSKLIRKERKSDMPLLLRLLIAVFPFLGSWTRML